MEEQEKKDKYSLFNGRRSADQYVKSYLKGVAWITGLTTAVVLPLAGWACLSILDHSFRLTAIEASRFTVEDGANLKNQTHSLEIMVTRISQEMKAQSGDLREIKDLLRRAAPYELRNG